MHTRTLTLAAAALLALPAVAHAAPNRMTQLAGPGASVDWDNDDNHLTGASTGTDTPCVMDCDDTLIFIGEQSKLSVNIDMPSMGAVDLDLYLYKSDASGTVGDAVADSAGGTPIEQVAAEIPSSGYYLVRVRGATTSDATYAGHAKLTASEQPAGTFPPAPVAEPTPATPPDAPAGSGATGASGAAGVAAGTGATGAGGTTGSTGTAARHVNTAPRAYVAKPTAAKVGLRLLRGTSSDDGHVKRVDVALVRTAGSRCTGLKASGSFVPLRSCRKPTYLHAKGTSAWSLKLRKGLAKGTYVAYARATDTQGKRQAKVTRMPFTVR